MILARKRRYRLDGEMLSLEEIIAKIEDGYMEVDSSLLESVQGEKILDLGCKIGVISSKIAQRNPQSHVVGVDYFPAYIDIARVVYKNRQNTTFLPMNAYDLKFEDGFFDCVCMFEVIEHLNNPVKALREVNRVLRKDGSFIISTNNVYYARFIAKYVLSLVTTQYRLRKMDHGACEEWFRHIYCWDLETFYTLMSEYGFEHEDHFFLGNLLFTSKNSFVRCFDKSLGYLFPIFRSVMVLKLRKIFELEQEKAF